MTVIGIQQTNRRMCRYVFVMFIFLCWPQDVYVQGLPSVSCEAGEVTEGEEATITCIFPDGSITPGNSNFVVKKFTASNPKDGTDIMDCFHVAGSTSEDPKCIFPDKSLGYNFTFKSKNDRQTVVIDPAKQSDAGEYGCDRISHMVARCILTVKDRTPTPDPDPGLSPGAIVGIVIGILGAVVLLGGAAYIVWRFKFRKQTPKDPIESKPDTKLGLKEEAQKLLTLPKTNVTAKPADEIDVEKPATDNENPSKPGKDGDRNSKDSTDASGKLPATDNINAWEAAKDGGP